MRRRRSTKVKLNTKLMVDVVSAGLIVRNLPKVINMVVPLDPMLSTVASVGGGYLAGAMFKRPDMANAAIAVGIAQFVDPLIDQFLGGTLIPENVSVPGGALPLPGGMEPVPALDDYLRLNDYVNNPHNRMTNVAYKDAY